MTMAVTSMRISTVCRRGDSGFDIDEANGSFAKFLASFLFLFFIAANILAFKYMDWRIVLSVLVASIFLPGFIVTRDNLESFVETKIGLDLWTYLFGIGFLACHYTKFFSA